MAFLLAIIGIYFADIKNIMQFILRVWLYLSPSIYGIERIPARFRGIFMLNPFTPIFIGYRDIIMYGRIPALEPLLVAFLISIVAFAGGFWLFSSQEPKLAKIL
jgi:ABC-type polysaccharide/polyol phosphate export permease